MKHHFQKLTAAEQAKAREAVIQDLKEVKAFASLTAHDQGPVSAYGILMSSSVLSMEQKNLIIDLLAEVREHYAAYRSPDGRMLPDQEGNWIHTQGEVANVLKSAAANQLDQIETEDALIAAMFSDSVKFVDTAITADNFTTHHLDGAAAACAVLQRRGFPPHRIASITQAIREHQVAPPEFMGFYYRATIASNLQKELDFGKLSRTEYDELMKVLDDMTVLGPDNLARIKQIAEVETAPLSRDGNGQWEVAFSREQREVLKYAGIDSWFVPHDPRWLADKKSLDTEFSLLPDLEQARRISQYKSSRVLIDGDAIDNYATLGGASKVVNRRGPDTLFRDSTVWDSLASIDSSFSDALRLLTPEGQQLAHQAHACRDRILHDTAFGIRAQLDSWLCAVGKDPSGCEIPFYNAPLEYPEPLNSSEQSRFQELQTQVEANPAGLSALETEMRALKYKGLNEKQIRDFEFAKIIRRRMADFLCMAHRTDGKLPGRYEPVRGSVKRKPLRQPAEV